MDHSISQTRRFLHFCRGPSAAPRARISPRSKQPCPRTASRMVILTVVPTVPAMSRSSMCSCQTACRGRDTITDRRRTDPCELRWLLPLGHDTKSHIREWQRVIECAAMSGSYVCSPPGRLGAMRICKRLLYEFSPHSAPLPGDRWIPVSLPPPAALPPTFSVKSQACEEAR